MTIQTNGNRLYRRETAATNLESEAFAAVLMMSSTGLALSILITILTAS